jgi:phage gp36-like protein
MAYSSQNDLLMMIAPEELAELTADAGDLPDELVVEKAIAQADAEIDAYLGGRYEVPVTPTPPRVKTLSVDMAIYHLYSRRSVIPPVRRDKYEAALAFLKAVAAGTVGLEGASGDASGGVGEVAELRSEPRLFSRTGLKDW